ncbi:MAG: response regulator [Candidatus Hodarchaeales archaeon]|jgi:DNA-binding NtrC family response regulator
MTINILHVDDEVPFLRLFKRYLELQDLNFQVDMLEKPEKIFSILEKKDYDIIISDFSMPVFNPRRVIDNYSSSVKIDGIFEKNIYNKQLIPELNNVINKKHQKNN